jgi:hypothetical protein
VCWLDEVTFEVEEDGSVYYVTRRPNEEHLDKNLKPTFKSGRTFIGVLSDGGIVSRAVDPFLIYTRMYTP